MIDAIANCIVGSVPYHVGECIEPSVGIFVRGDIVLETAIVRPACWQTSLLSSRRREGLRSAERVDSQSTTSTAKLGRITGTCHIAIALIGSQYPSIIDGVIAEALLSPLHTGNRVALAGAKVGARLQSHTLAIWCLIACKNAAVDTINPAALICPAGRKARGGNET